MGGGGVCRVNEVSLAKTTRSLEFKFRRLARRQGRSRSQVQAPCQPAPSAARTQAAPPTLAPRCPDPRARLASSGARRGGGGTAGSSLPTSGHAGAAEDRRRRRGGLGWERVGGLESPGGTENTPRGRRREDGAEACGETGRHTVGQPGSPRAVEGGRTSHRSVPPRCWELPAH